MTRTKLRIVLLALVGSILVVSAPVSAADDPASSSERSPLESPDPVSEVWLSFTGSDQLNAAASAGIDVEHNIVRVPTGIEAPALVTQEQLALLDTMGVEVISDAERFEWDLSADGAQSFALRSGASSPFSSFETLLALDHDATVRIVRADYFTTKGQGFLYVEARTTLGQQSNPVITMQLANDTGPSTPFGTARNMSRFIDSGVYMFHRNLAKVAVRPSQIRVTSSTGGTAIGYVSDWLEEPVVPMTDTPGYKYDFVDNYKTVAQLYGRFEEIADQYPRIAEIVELPNKTNGYQRQAQATIGGTGQAAVVVTSAAWGHEGGNEITVRFVNPGVADSPLSVLVLGKAITVSLATGSTGALTSTAAQVAAAILAQSGGLVARSHPYRNNAGTGIVQPTATTVALTDFLEREAHGRSGGRPRPRPVHGPRAADRQVPQRHEARRPDPGAGPRARVGAGDDHARGRRAARAELRHRPGDKEDRRQHRPLPDPLEQPGRQQLQHVQLRLSAAQHDEPLPEHERRSGQPERVGRRPEPELPLRVGLRRLRRRVDELHDDTYQGPSKLSEPESKNIIWLAESFPNVKFMMSVHSNGGQLFWQPGAYIANGRIVAPRPPLGHEAFYWQSASRILSHVKAERQTVVTPENVGGSADVLYSSAGNVREDLYNNHGVFAFGWEVGGSVYNTATGNFVSGSFQPAWVGNPDIVSGHSETMEYANGVMEMFRIAAEWGKDRVKPKTQLIPGRGKYSGPVDVHFETSEPADIYYTTDGTVPSLQSPRYKATEFREPGQTFHVTETTVFKWFSVDTAGNFERGFDPDDPGRNYRSEEIRILG